MAGNSTLPSVEGVRKFLGDRGKLIAAAAEAIARQEHTDMRRMTMSAAAACTPEQFEQVVKFSAGHSRMIRKAAAAVDAVLASLEGASHGH